MLDKISAIFAVVALNSILPVLCEVHLIDHGEVLKINEADLNDAVIGTNQFLEDIGRRDWNINY